MSYTTGDGSAAANVRGPVTILLLLIAAPLPVNAVRSEESPGQRSEGAGFPRSRFEIDGKSVLIVAPRETAEGKPRDGRGEFFGHKPEPDIALLHGAAAAVVRRQENTGVVAQRYNLSIQP